MTQTQASAINAGQPIATAAKKPDGEAVLDRTIQETQERRRSIVAKAGAFLGLSPDKVCNLLRNVWRTSKSQPPLTDQEMFAGISMIARYELDPIANEITVTRDDKGRLLTILRLDGWVRILDRTDHYDGFEQEEEWRKDDHDQEYLHRVTTRIYSKTRKYPAAYNAYASEYAKISGFAAQKIPWHMLGVFSFRHAARLFTAIPGNVVTEEEARFIVAGAAQDNMVGEEGQIGPTEELERMLTPNREKPPALPAEDESSIDAADRAHELDDEVLDTADDVSSADADPDPRLLDSCVQEYAAAIAEITTEKSIASMRDRVNSDKLLHSDSPASAKALQRVLTDLEAANRRVSGGSKRKAERYLIP